MPSENETGSRPPIAGPEIATQLATTAEALDGETAGERCARGATELKSHEALLELEKEIATAAAYEATIIHRLLAAIRLFDEWEGWARQGHPNASAWLSWRIGLSPGAARERVRVARALGRLPKMDEALRTAQISYSKARALTRVATPENEEWLLATAADCTASELEARCRSFENNALEQVERRPRTRAERSYLTFHDTGDGMVAISGKLLPDDAAKVQLAIQTALIRAIEAEGGDATQGAEARREAAPAVDGGSRVVPERADDAGETKGDESAKPAEVRSGSMAPASHLLVGRGDPHASTTCSRVDAFLAVVDAYLEHGGLPTGRAPEAELLVEVSAEALAGRSNAPGLLQDGGVLGIETIRRQACDGAVVPVAVDPAGNRLDVGRRSRTIPAPIRRALRLRDRGCRFPGCTNVARLQGHHLVHWAQGGETSLDNLVLLCRSHHWHVHEGGYDVKKLDGQVIFFDRTGRPIPAAPPLLPGEQPSEGYLAWLLEYGPGLGYSLPLPTGHGAPVDWNSLHDEWLAATYERRELTVREEITNSASRRRASA